MTNWLKEMIGQRRVLKTKRDACAIRSKARKQYAFIIMLSIAPRIGHGYRNH